MQSDKATLKGLSLQIELGRLAIQPFGYASNQSYEAHVRARDLAEQPGQTVRLVIAASGMNMNLGSMARNAEALNLLGFFENTDIDKRRFFADSARYHKICAENGHDAYIS